MKKAWLQALRRALSAVACVGLSVVALAAGKPEAPAEPSPVLDPLGRNTPYGTVSGFIRAAKADDLQLAARYLQSSASPSRTEQLASKLQVVLNRGVHVSLDSLSRSPQGRIDDGFPLDVEKLGTATYGNDKSLDILLRRVDVKDGDPVWLFAAESLPGLDEAADQLELPWGERIWPEQFRDKRIGSWPAFVLVNTLIFAPLSLGLAWLLNRLLVAILRRVLARGNPIAAAARTTRIGRPMFWLVFALLVEGAAPFASVVSSRAMIGTFGTVLALVSLTWLFVRIATLVTDAKVANLRAAGHANRVAGTELANWMVSALLIATGLFLCVRRMGFDVTAAIAGLGVGGLAIAFAAQKTIENLFGTVTVIGDRAIQVGDRFAAGPVLGSVESIGLRSTRIRTLDRALVSIPNGQLASMTVGNLQQRDKFLFDQTFRLATDMSASQLRSLLARMRDTLAAHPSVEQPTMRVRLSRFGEFAIEVHAFAYLLTTVQEEFFELQEDLLLKILDAIESAGARIAVSTPTAYLVSGLSAAPASAPALPGSRVPSPDRVPAAAK